MHRRHFLQTALLAALASTVRARDAWEFTAASFNILFQDPKDAGEYTWHNRREGVARWLREQDLDLLALQEVLPPQRADLDRALGDRYASVGRPVNPDGTGATNLVLYRRDRFTLEESRTQWLSETEQPGSHGWGADEARTATVARLHCAGGILNVVALHLDPHEVRIREESVKLLLQRLPEGPLLLLGDLNADEDEPAVKLLQQALTDSWRHKHQGPPLPSFHGFDRGKYPKRHIDYAFVRHLTVLAADIVRPPGPFLSDHDPLVLRLAL